MGGGGERSGRYNCPITTDFKTIKYFPVQVGTDTDWEKISAGCTHTVAQKKDGSMWKIRLTDNSVSRIERASGWVSFSAFDEDVAGVDKDGFLNFCNLTNYGNIGHIGYANNWKTVSVGRSGIGAIKKDGTLWLNKIGRQWR